MRSSEIAYRDQEYERDIMRVLGSIFERLQPYLPEPITKDHYQLINFFNNLYKEYRCGLQDQAFGSRFRVLIDKEFICNAIVKDWKKKLKNGDIPLAALPKESETEVSFGLVSEEDVVKVKVVGPNE